MDPAPRTVSGKRVAITIVIIIAVAVIAAGYLLLKNYQAMPRTP